MIHVPDDKGRPTGRLYPNEESGLSDKNVDRLGKGRGQLDVELLLPMEAKSTGPSITIQLVNKQLHGGARRN